MGAVSSDTNSRILEMYNNRNYSEAVELFENSGEHSGEIYNKIGLCYKYGYGIDKNAEKAFEFFQKSASLGHPGGMLNLGQCYYDGWGTKKNMESFEKYNRMSANLGNSRAHSNLGIYNFNKKNYKEAIKFFENSIEFEESRALLGLLYFYGDEYGEGIEKNYEKAFELFLSSPNDSVSKEHIGQCYYFGLGTTQDFEKAFENFKKSSTIEAKFYLGVCYQLGTGTEKNINKAVQIYKELSERGHARSQNNLGVIYESIIKNENAFKLYQCSASKNNEFAIDNLVRCFEKGIGTDKNPEMCKILKNTFVIV